MMSIRTPVARSPLNAVQLLALLATAVMTAACSISGSSGIATSALTPAPGAAAGAEKAAKRTPAKVALLLPLSGAPQTMALAKGMKQAGELALFDIENAPVELMVKDDKGTPEGAKAAAEEAVKQGAELIIGPLFARSVAAVAPIARAGKVPVLAFSNDQQVAGNGIYLVSFLVEPEVERVVGYAIQQGKRRFAALVSADNYGIAAQSAFRAAVERGGGEVAAIETYPVEANGMVEPARKLATTIREAETSGAPVDALFVPGGPETLPHLGPLLAYAGVDTAKIKLIGTGGWDNPNASRENVLLGAWYPSPDPRGWREFSDKFVRTFGSAPPRLASLSHDAVTLAVALAEQPAGQRFAPTNLTRPAGFNGVDGTLRLLPSGFAERGLAITEIQKMGSVVIDPAPTAAGVGPPMSVAGPSSRLN